MGNHYPPNPPDRKTTGRQMTDIQLKQLNKREGNWRYNEQMRLFFDNHAICKKQPAMTIEELRELNDKRNRLPRGKASASEHQLQVECVMWFRLQYPQLAPLLFAIPNGGARAKKTAAMLKAEGVTAGVPDLQLAIPTIDNSAHGLFIEMKNGTSNTLSKEQRYMKDRLESAGYEYRCCRNFEDFRQNTTNYIRRIDPKFIAGKFQKSDKSG